MIRNIWLSCAVTAVSLAGAGALASAADAKAPAPLTFAGKLADISSNYGNGDFGRWQVDRWGLPTYQYTADELTNANTAQPDVDGSRADQNQVGNDNVKGFAANDGYLELWSQQLLNEYANKYDPSADHFSGGFGYLNVDGKIGGTLYSANSTGEQFKRWFGVGYYRRQISFQGLGVREITSAPFGSDPVLLDDVTITNNSRSAKTADWYEYWDVNPVDQGTLGQQLGLDAPSWNAASETLTADEIPTIPTDNEPLANFAAVLRGPEPTWETSVSKFFGSGSEAAPAEVKANQLSETVAPSDLLLQTGKTLFVFRQAVKLAPGKSITLRFIYGLAHTYDIASLVAKYRAAIDPLQASEHDWVAQMPRVNFGSSYRWVSREVDWDAYLLRSATVYEERSAEHTITQGGDYQYGLGDNLGTRSWLHYSWPITFSDPDLTQQILQYAIKLQPPGPAIDAQLPYGTLGLFTPFYLGTSNDLDFWLLQAAAQYGLATRDTKFFHTEVPFVEGLGEATVWQHLKIAFEHTQDYLSLFGEYITGATGDWNDLSTEFELMTESTDILAQLTYCYPQLAQLADLYGDRTFAAQLRAAAAVDLRSLRAQWTGKGWYSRGYAGISQVGNGAIFEEPQPWAILAGAPTPAQAKLLVANIHRYLDGYGAPHGPTQLGTSQVPAADDPGVSEHGPIPVDVGDFPTISLGSGSTTAGADEWPGGDWYDLNGDLTWAYASLQGVVPGAVNDAWWEYTRNTLARHAAVYPQSWDGVLNVDDVCFGFYSPTPSQCGNRLSTAFGGQITEQPTWMEMDAINLAGVTPDQAGYEIDPHLPMTSFSVRFPLVGVSRAPGLIRGYLTTQTSGPLQMQVAIPPDTNGRQLIAFDGTRRVPAKIVGGLLDFLIKTTAGRPAAWAVQAQ